MSEVVFDFSVEICVEYDCSTNIEDSVTILLWVCMQARSRMFNREIVTLALHFL